MQLVEKPVRPWVTPTVLQIGVMNLMNVMNDEA